MDKCRLCLKYSKKLLNIFHNHDGTTFADMIASFTNIKLSKDDGITAKICLTCHRKTKDCYNFKLQVERSDLVLQECSSVKRFKFSNFHDLSFSTEISGFDIKKQIPVGVTDKIINNNESFTYNDTLIKKVPADEKKPLSVLEFLNSIKGEPENEYDGDCNYEVDIEYDPDLTKDPDFGTKQPIKPKNKKQPKHKLEGYTILSKPVKPVFLADFAIVPKRRIRKIINKRDRLLHICPCCGKMVKNLNSHMVVHSGLKPHKCDKCGISFRWLSTLKKHTKEKHTGIEKFKCDSCTAVFTSKAAILSHMSSHSTTRDFVCSLCNKSFKRIAHLNRHTHLVHNTLGAKPYKCEQCPDSFKTGYNLRHHMRVHTGERPYKCEMCSQPYSYKHDFNRHCMNKHGVCFKRRSIHVMNEEVLLQERILMRDLILRLNGILKDDQPINPFEGPQAALAFDQIVKAIQSGKIVVDLQL